MDKPFAEGATVAAAQSQVSTRVDGEAIILSLDSGSYYSLDRVGTFVWNFLQTPRTIGSIRESLMEQYDVDADRCEADLQTLITNLADEGLVTVTDE